MTIEKRKCLYCLEIKEAKHFHSFLRVRTGRIELASKCKQCKSKDRIKKVKSTLTLPSDNSYPKVT